MSPTAADRPLRAFLSYSRLDGAVADQIRRRLIEAGFEAYFDLQDILPAEPWRERLGALIADADAVVFVLSPDSVASPICDWEVNEAERLEKRIIPLVIRDGEDEKVPGRLKRLNYVFMRTHDEQLTGFTKLCDALLTDVGWVREHTRLGQLAADWAGKGKAEEFLLRGNALSAAELWVSRRHSTEQIATDLHRDFISASRTSEQARAAAEQLQVIRTRSVQRRVAILLTVLGIMLSVGAVGTVWQARETARREATVLASAAQKALDDGENQRAARIALLGLPKQRSFPMLTPWSEELEAKLRTAYLRGSHHIAQLNNQGAVSSATMSPDGSRIAVLPDGFAKNKSVALWNVEKAALIKQLPHLKTPTQVQFNKDGTRLLTNDFETITLWDGIYGSLIYSLPDRNLIAYPQFNSDGTVLLTRSDNGVVKLWDAKTGGWLAEFSHPGVIHAVFSPNGKLIATASSDGNVKLWDSDRHILAAALAFSAPTREPMFSPDNRYLLTWGRIGASESLLWETRRGKLVHRLPLENSSGARFSPDSQRILAYSEAGLAKLWTVGEGTLIADLPHGERLVRAEFSPDGTRILTSAQDHEPKLWDGNNGSLIAGLRQDAAEHRADFSPDGSRVLVTNIAGSPTLWDAETGTLVSKLGVGTPNAVFSKQGHRVVSYAGLTAYLFDTENGALLATLPHNGSLRNPFFSPDGARLITLSGSAAFIWSANRGSSTAELGYMKGPVHVALSPDEKRIVATYASKYFPELYDANGSLIARLAHGGEVVQASFYLEGRRLLTKSQDGIVKIWDTKHGTFVKELGAESQVAFVAFSSDRQKVAVQSRSGFQLLAGDSGKALATFAGAACALVGPNAQRILICQADGSAGLWNADKGELISSLPNLDRLAAIAASDDGLSLVTISDQGTAQLWNAVNGEFITILHEGKRVSSAAYVPFQKRVLTYSREEVGGAKLWDSERGSQIAELSKERVADVWISPEGTRALLNTEPTAALVDLTTGSVLAVLVHPRGFRTAEFSSDGKRILTNHHDGAVSLWDAKNGRLVATLIKSGVEDKPLYSMKFSGNGRLAVTTDVSNALIWDAETGHLLVSLNQRLPTDIAMSFDGMTLLVHSLNTSVGIWNLAPAVSMGELELRGRACEALRGAQTISMYDAQDPILRGHVGVNACAPGVLSLAYWSDVAHHYLGRNLAAPPAR